MSVGKEIGFRVMSDKEIGTPEGSFGFFYHPGLAQIYMSRAPNDDLKSYKGDGDWFKVAYAGPLDNSDWKLFHDGGVETDVCHDAFVLPSALLLSQNFRESL